MEYLARKINSSRWEPTDYTGLEDVRADAITICLKTESDTLSFWYCNANKDDVSEVVLAFASTMKVIEGLHIVLLEKSTFDNNGFIVKPNPEGTNTPIEALRNRHVDIVNLTMTQLCLVAKQIAVKVRQNSQLYLFTRESVLDILCEAVTMGRLHVSNLKSDARRAVDGRLGMQKL